MKVCVASPYPLDHLKGNSVTTRRIVSILRERGVEARESDGWDGGEADVLIALHAVKGADAVFEYQSANPKGRVAVLMTGTDLYEDFAKGSEVGERVLDQADAIVVVQEAAIERLPQRVRKKAVVIPASLDEVSVKASPGGGGPFVISVVGHPRPVKRPFLTIEAVAKHPEWQEVEVWQIGEALDEESRVRAEQWEREDDRYRWFGAVARKRALDLCAKSSLTVNSSLLEGGANAVLEAMTMGVPVLASRIEGNVGLLGEDYSGYFDEGRLEERISEVLEGRVDPADWVTEAKRRLPLFSRAREGTSWLDLLGKLNYQEASYD